MASNRLALQQPFPRHEAQRLAFIVGPSPRPRRCNGWSAQSIIPAVSYDKLAVDSAVLRTLLLQQRVRILPKDIQEVIVDFDAPHSRLNDQQQGRFYHDHCEGYYYLPLLAFIGEVPV